MDLGQAFTIENKRGTTVSLLEYGATLTRVRMRDRAGRLGDILAGHPDPVSYAAMPPIYWGSTVGRFANRIKDGAITLNGKEYMLERNDGPNHLHGGLDGFSFKRFHGERLGNAVKFTYISPAGEGGYPGALSVEALYALTDDDALSVVYTATTDAPTLCNLTNHAYWNLNGSGAIADHTLYMNAAYYLPIDAAGAATGEVFAVQNTPFNFMEPKPIGRDFDKALPGYDHAFLSRSNDVAVLAARLSSAKSGRTLSVFTNRPSIQLYTGNSLPPTPSHDGVLLEKYQTVCLETQDWPCSPGYAHFKSSVLNPGETYRAETIFKLDVS